MKKDTPAKPNKLELLANKMLNIGKGLTYAEFKKAAWLAIDKAAEKSHLT
ncbi:MAG: hypothetical protein ABFC94_18345 [Syntrophomonas sp.]